MQGEFNTQLEDIVCCNCNIEGSEILTCDIKTGQCRCKPYVIGKTCDTCEIGYWGIKSRNGCSPCECDIVGSIDNTCDSHTGQCRCKPGIGGLRCDNCLANFYGFSDKGCKKCDFCDKPGHICDPDTGRCVCPPFSQGESCQRCVPNSWGIEPYKGCKVCRCDQFGAARSQCDIFTGICECRQGYVGHKCNQCAIGFYGYPRCRRCNCDIAGTVPEKCDPDTGLCPCDEQGHCTCKTNVIGPKCDECRNGTFGLEQSNPAGCTQCFCFGRTSHCTQAGLTWGQIRLKSSRSLKIWKQDDYWGYNQHTPHIAYIRHTIPKRNMYPQGHNHPSELIELPHRKLNKTNGLHLIPEYMGNITLGLYRFYNTPLYWQLPSDFVGDRIVSYGGFLQFSLETVNITELYSHKILNRYPLVLLRGNDIAIAHFPLLPPIKGKYEVRLHESLWTVYHEQDHALLYKDKKVTRDLLMVILQNVQAILIRSSEAEQFSKAVLYDATLDTAIEVIGRPPPIARGVELCECPKKYNSSSCQNPSIGFYRWHNTITANSTIVIDLIGEAKPCECNGRSDICDTETGYCLNCTENTAGATCEICAEGHYGDPQTTGCRACPCPTTTRTFARSCYQQYNNIFVCECREGYTGKYCDRCSLGYYGYPDRDGGSCQPCLCNVYGTENHECDERTGQCSCKPGISGRDCSICNQPRHILEHNQCVPCDNCTQTLLNDIEAMMYNLTLNTDHIKNGIIPPPWENLYHVEREASGLDKSFKDWNRLTNKIESMPMKPYEQLKRDSKKLEHRLERIKKRGERANNEASQIRTSADEILDQIVDMRQEMEKTVDVLEKYTGVYISVADALKEGEKLLNSILERDFSEQIYDAERVLRECTITLDQLLKIKEDLDDFYSRVNDMESIIGQTLKKIDNVKKIIDENQINLQNFKNKLDHIDRLEDDLHKMDSDILLEDSRKLYNNSKDAFDKLNIKGIEFHKLKQRVREREQEANDLSQIVWAAQQHSKNLTAISDKIKNLLSKTRTEADIALKASQAYNDIIASIEAARQAASEAILANRNLNETLFPPDDDSLFDRSTNVLADTKRLKHRAENQKNKINNLKEREMYLKKITIQTIKDMIWNSGLQDNNMTLELQKFNIDAIRDKVRNILNTAIQESMDMKNVYNQAKKMLDQKSYKLIPALNELNASEANITITVSSTEELLAEAQGNLSKMNAELHIIDRLAISQKQTFNELNDTFALHLQKLKNIIMEARRLASEIQIPLRSTDDSKCSRIYQPHSAAPSTSTTISFVISATTDIQNSSLFYLFGAENHFIAVEMVNRRIRLIWNLGSDTASIRHPEKIETLTPNSGYYYDVEIERIRNIGKLLVKKKFKYDGSTVRDSSSEPVSGKTNSNATLLKLGESPQIVIGSVVGNAFKNENMLADQGLKVSIYDVFLDEKPVGLWNYRYTNKGACESDKYWSYTANTYQFNGNGYAVRTRSSSNPKTSMSVMLTFKTFDENALLLVIISMDKKSYLSISLKDGRVVYFVQYVGESILKIETNEKYNIGKEINIEGSRIFDRKTGEQAILIVDKKEKLGKPDIPLNKKDQLPDFKNATYYFGGVPPNFFTKMKDSIVHELSPSNSLLGCMSNILINTERHDPMDSEHDGVEYSCSDKNLNKVGFFGKGFIKLGLSDLQKVLSLSFVFHTRQDNALIMFMKIKSDSKKEFGHYQITLLNGKIYVEIKLGKNIISLTSQKTYSDGIYHAVTIIIENKSTELRIDDYFEDSKTQKIIGLPDDIYFGGFPDKDNGEMIVDNKSPFTGTIKDVIINDKIILFDSPLEFEDVKIGRHGPDMPASLLIIPSHIPMGINTSVDRCSKITNYAPEDGALKFGDAPHSYSHYQFPFTKFWQKNFTLQFEFRTFYPNGMLFVTPGFREKQRHFIVLQLKNKDISFTVRGKPKLHIQTTTNDGNWHQIKVRSQNRKLTLTVDGKSWNAGKAPKKLNIANMMYIGGLPKFAHRLPENVVKELEPFKGCVRNFIVNDFPRDLTTNMDNVRQCFPKIERGSYFSGDGYAVYNKHFQIDGGLELSLEFRTSEINGILMTMSESVGQPAFSLELHNGRVIISGEVGLDKPIRLEAGPASVYGLCDNKWHNVTAFYSKDEITIVVDRSYLNRWVQRNAPVYNDMNIDSPLFIGGLPDSVLGGTLQTRDNFKGCIRNVVIGNEQKDWTDMEELHNILLSSCPVA